LLPPNAMESAVDARMQARSGTPEPELCCTPVESCLLLGLGDRSSSEVDGWGARRAFGATRGNGRRQQSVLSRNIDGASTASASTAVVGHIQSTGQSRGMERVGVEVDVVGLGGLLWVEVKAVRGRLTMRDWLHAMGSNTRSLKDQVRQADMAQCTSCLPYLDTRSPPLPSGCLLKLTVTGCSGSKSRLLTIFKVTEGRSTIRDLLHRTGSNTRSLSAQV
jgi:hypothetical protein